MVKIQRQTQKVFAQNAANDQLAAFGTMASGAPIYTDDIEALQTAKYQEGWKSAVVSDNAPFMEEMNGIQYGLSKQIAYILQQGIPEYDDGTTYYQNSWCQVNGTFYQSLTDDNIGNDPASSTTNWKPWQFIDIATDEEIAAGESENTAVTPKQLKESIDNAIIGALSYQGTWNADGQTDYSSIELPVKAGYMYYVEGAATIGDIDWETGDFLLVNSDVEVGGSLTDVIRLDHTFAGGDGFLKTDGSNAAERFTIGSTVFSGNNIGTSAPSITIGSMGMQSQGLQIFPTNGNVSVMTAFGDFTINTYTNKALYNNVEIAKTDLSNISANTSSTAFDGQWIAESLDLITYATFNGNNAKQTFDVSSYLPNDGKYYKVQVNARGRTGMANGNYVNLILSGGLSSSQLAYEITRTTNSTLFGKSVELVVTPDRKIVLENISASGDCEQFTLGLRAYRRIGTNT